MQKQTRKITQTNYSFTVTLPHEWVKKYGLDSGGQVGLEIQKNGSLVIRPVKA